MKRISKSDEEKVAEKIANTVKDSTINLDEVGRYLGRMIPSYLLKRIAIIVEAGELEREVVDVKNSYEPLF